MKALLVLASNTGNTRTFVKFLDKHCDFDLVIDDEFTLSPLPYDHIVFGSYTWGNGKIPKKMKQYLINHHKDLNEKNVFIFGSGISVYPHFCGAVDGIKKICSDSGSNVDGTYKFEQRFNEGDLTIKEKEKLISAIRKWSTS